jgi:serine/threonine protein kinase
MTHSDSQLLSIFADALACDSPESQAAHLDRKCGGDVALRAEIDALLKAHNEAGEFLKESESPVALASISDEDRRECAGTIIGPYKLLEQIGEGGMGVVYMAAQQTPVRRRVAVKIIKPGMDTRKVIARFEAERQALALMDHPNIARVLDAGATDLGRPYFVMELVRGIPITEYCDEKSLPVRERLELFVPVCQAVHHAHQKGIIHRDLKPTNVLVTMQDGRAMPKIIDFGVAKATGQQLTEKTLFTAFSQMVGTPLYMSPEQAEMASVDVDTRSDIYSLGVMLYELLTGTTPFEQERLRKATFDEIRRIIREEEPPHPSTRLNTLAGDLATTVAERHRSDARRLVQTVRGELDWIVMKCLDKDRNLRYDTANSLATDIERHLNDEQVLACPPSAVYRFRKIARRNKTLLATTAVVAASLVLGIVASLSQARRALEAEQLATLRLEAEQTARQEADRQRRAAREAQALAQKNAEEAEAQRNRAEANLRKAREMVDQLLTQVGEGSHDIGPQMEPVRGELLAEALKLYEGFLDQNSTDPQVRLATARTWERIGGIHEELEQYPQSQKAYHESISQLEKLVEEFPSEPTYRDALAHSYGSLGFLCSWALGEQESAEELFSKALTVEEALAKEFPNRPDYQALLATMARGRGLSQHHRGRRDEAEKSLRQALEISVKLARENPSQSSRPGLYYYNLGQVLYWSQQTDKAEAAFRDALAILERFGPDPTQLNRGARFVLSDINLHLGLILSQTGRTEEAEERMRSALAVRQKMVADFPGQPRLQAELALVEVPLGDLLAKTHRDAEAEQLLRHARDMMEVAADKGKVLYPLFESQSHLADFLKDTKRTEEAEQVHRQALALYEKLAADNANVPDYRKDVVWRHLLLALFLRDTGQQSEAVQVLKPALAASEKLVAEFPQNAQYHEQWTRIRLELIPLLRSTGRVSDIEDVHRQTIALYERLENSNAYLYEGGLKSHDVEHGYSLNAVEETDKRREAEEYYPTRAKEIIEWGLRQLEEQLISVEPANWFHWASRGRLKTRLGDLDEAAADFAKAAELQGEKGPGYFQAGWWVVGPYPESLTEPFPPETDPDPTRPVAAAKEAVAEGAQADLAPKTPQNGPAPKMLRWLPAYPDSSGRLDLAEPFNLGEHTTAYALTRVYSPKDQVMALALSSDDQLRLWFNGSLVHEQPWRGVAGEDRNFVELSFRAGWNTLLAKVVNRIDQGHALYLRFSKDPIDFGRAYSQSGQWERAAAALGQAATDVMKADQPRPGDVELGNQHALLDYQHALALLGAGDTGDYRAACPVMMDRYGDTADAATAHWVAWTCLLAPDALEDITPAVKLAEKATAAAPSNLQYLQTLGGILYRADRWEEAVERLREAERLNANPSEAYASSPAYRWFFQAMAQHQLGNADEATRLVDKAVQWTEQALREHEEGKTPLAWNRRLTLKLLRAEAEALLNRGRSDHKVNEPPATPTTEVGPEQE